MEAVVTPHKSSWTERMNEKLTVRNISLLMIHPYTKLNMWVGKNIGKCVILILHIDMRQYRYFDIKSQTLTTRKQFLLLSMSLVSLTCVARVIWKISIVRVTISCTVSCPILQRNTGEISLRAPWGGMGCWPAPGAAPGGRWGGCCCCCCCEGIPAIPGFWGKEAAISTQICGVRWYKTKVMFY